MRIEQKKKTSREVRFEKVLKELAKAVLAAIVFILCIFAFVDLYMGDFFSVYDKHMQIIWWRKIVRWLMYDAIIAVQVLCLLVVRASTHRAKFDWQLILED